MEPQDKPVIVVDDDVTSDLRNGYVPAPLTLRVLRNVGTRQVVIHQVNPHRGIASAIYVHREQVPALIAYLSSVDLG